MAGPGGTAIDDVGTSDPGLATGFMDVATEDQERLNALDELANGTAPRVDTARGQIDRAMGRGMRHQDEVAGWRGFSEAGIEASGDLGFRNFVRGANGDGGGGTAEEGDVVQNPGAAVDGNAKPLEGVVDVGRIHVSGDSEEVGRERAPGLKGTFDVGGCSVGGDVPGDEDQIDRLRSFQDASDGLEAVMDIGKSDKFHEGEF